MIFPIFDGLDEVPGGQITTALEQINTSFADGAGFVLTCRTHEYTEASVAIVHAAVIEPQAVDIPALIDFLPSSTPPALQRQWDPVFAEISRNPGGPLAQTLSLPLMASLASTVYADETHRPAELLRADRFGSREAIEIHLLDEFIPSLIRLDKARDKPARRDWDTGKTTRWLAFLAAHLSDCGTPDLAWWCLYRALPIFRQHSFQHSAYLPGLAACLAAAATLLPFFGIRYAGLTGLAYGSAICIACLRAQSGRPSQSTDAGARRRMWRERIWLGVWSGLAFGFWIGLRTGWSTGPLVGLRTGLVEGAVAGLIIALAAYIADVPAPPETPTRVDFRFRGHLGSLVRTLSVGLRAGLIFGLVEGALAAVKHQHATDPSLGTHVLAYGLISGSIFGLGSWLARWTRTPVESDDARSPTATLRADRTGAALLSLLLSVTAGAAFGLNSNLHYNLPGVLVNSVIGFFVGLLSGAWPTYFLASRLLWLHGRVPLPLMSFLEDCRRVRILRQVGPVYQFRHTRLRGHLAERYTGAAPRGERASARHASLVLHPRPADGGGNNGHGRLQRRPPGRHRRAEPRNPVGSDSRRG